MACTEKYTRTFSPSIYFASAWKWERKNHWIISFYGFIVIARTRYEFENGCNLIWFIVICTQTFFMLFHMQQTTSHKVSDLNIWWPLKMCGLQENLQHFNGLDSIRGEKKRTICDTLWVGSVWMMNKSHMKTEGVEKMVRTVNPFSRLWLILFRFTGNLTYFFPPVNERIQHVSFYLRSTLTLMINWVYRYLLDFIVDILKSDTFFC